MTSNGKLKNIPPSPLTTSNTNHIFHLNYLHSTQPHQNDNKMLRMFCRNVFSITNHNNHRHKGNIIIQWQHEQTKWQRKARFHEKRSNPIWPIDKETHKNVSQTVSKKKKQRNGNPWKAFIWTVLSLLVFSNFWKPFNGFWILINEYFRSDLWLKWEFD